MIQRKLNPTQNADNTAYVTDSLSGCCGADNTPCNYSLTYTQSNAVSALTVTQDGGNVALPLTAATTSAADVRTAILNALTDAGYFEDGVGYVGVIVLDLGSTLSVEITGNITCVSLTHAGGTANFTAACNQRGLRTLTFAAYVGGASGAVNTTVYVDGVGSNMGAVTPGTTTASALKTAIETALTTLGTIGTATVTANGSTDYLVVIAGTDCSKYIRIGTANPTVTTCVQDWV